ncbi:FecR family protein [Neotamlana nanhaiensis]|uniref:FecR family protein n=1 Tax=Neotamlana nanhaiensis TaxID=1382798 RepID=UPI00069A6380|nr:FecR domain-containing protein [Tamlana nanhaiensis]
MNDIFYISKLIIKKKIKVLTDAEKPQLKQFKKEFPFIKEVEIEELIGGLDSYSAIDKEKAWKAIEKKYKQRNQKPVFRLFKKSWHKFVAAAILVGVLATTFYFNDGLFNTSIETTPTIVNTNAIEPGTDKATLTLGDGSVVELEKGSTVATQNANSNGEQIVYTSDGESKSKTEYNYLTIPRGGQFHVVLSDGTEVWLNSETQLKYPVAFVEGQTRQVELVYGEAYFDVSPSTKHKGTKFMVINQSQNVEVLGTEFNIKAYKDEENIYTTLVEGKVSVNTKNSHKVLNPSEQSNLNLLNDGITVSQVNVYNEISWKDGIFSFEQKPLEEITKVLSRWYDVDFVIENKSLKDATFTGVLGKNQSIEKILSNIKTLSIIENYEINYKTITLK